MSLLLAFLAASGAAASAAYDPTLPSTRPATSQEVAQIQDYTRSLSKEWLKGLLKIDINLLEAQWRERTRGVGRIQAEAAASAPAPAAPGAPAPPQEPVLYALSLRLEQYDDLLRVTRDRQDIPFALRLDGKGALLRGLLKLRTSLFLPLSWKDELRAEASVPLPWGWTFKSAYANRLGLSRVQAGLGTQVMKDWNLDYDWRLTFGQEQSETSHGVKLGRQF